MAADGSIPAQLRPSTLTDVLNYLEIDERVDTRRRAEMASAVRTVCRVLRTDPSLVPADLRQLRMRLKNLTAATAGVGIRRWNNIRSLMLRALKHCGIKAMPGRYRETHAPEWELLRARLPDRRFQSGLSRFLSYCTANGIAPDEVTSETFVSFGAELDQTSMSRDPGALYRDTTQLWNRAAETIAGWPQVIAEVPDRRRDFAFPLERFPRAFRSDVERYLTQRADPDVFSENHAKPARPTTLRNRRHNC